MTPDGRPIPWPEGEDVGTYEDSQSMVHSKIGNKKHMFQHTSPLSQPVNQLAAGILEASRDNTHTHPKQSTMRRLLVPPRVRHNCSSENGTCLTTIVLCKLFV